LLLIISCPFHPAFSSQTLNTLLHRPSSFGPLTAIYLYTFCLPSVS
jgi:hypothetical protein